MLAIPPSSSSTGASSACSVGTFVGTLAALTQYDRSIFSDMSLHDGILTTKWVEKQQLEDGGGGEDQAESRTQTQTEIEIEKEAVEEEVREEADLVDDWARQYQESLSRSKQGQQEGSEEVEAGAGVDETVPAEDNNEDEYYEDTYDDYDHDEILIDEEGIDELHTPEYTGNSDLYATSFLSGGLGPPDSLLANGLRVGSVSAGEVQLQTLQQELEAEGVAVEYKLGLAGAGAMLLCGGQVSKNEHVVCFHIVHCERCPYNLSLYLYLHYSSCLSIYLSISMSIVVSVYHCICLHIYYIYLFINFSIWYVFPSLACFLR